jgi:hypothetical protein
VATSQLGIKSESECKYSKDQNSLDFEHFLKDIELNGPEIVEATA